METLAFLQNRLGALAIVSGRSLRSIDEMTAPYKFAAAGQHGLEIRSLQGKVEKAVVKSNNLARIIKEVEALQRDYPDLLIEKKSMSLALHYRAAQSWKRRLLIFHSHS